MQENILWTQAFRCRRINAGTRWYEYIDAGTPTNGYKLKMQVQISFLKKHLPKKKQTYHFKGFSTCSLRAAGSVD